MSEQFSETHLPVTQRLLLRGLAILGLVVVAGAAVSIVPHGARATRGDGPYTGTVAEFGRLQTSLDATQGQLELATIELDRAKQIIELSGRFGVPADMAATVYDHALRAGLDPQLGFEIVRIESRFNPRAVSTAGAIGLTQLMLKTAAFYDTTVTAEALFDPETNLSIGFRYFRDLLTRYDGDLRIALLAYNRGPQRVGELLARGADPANGYAASVLGGYRSGPAPQ